MIDVVGGGASVMNCAHDFMRLVTTLLHDVNFTGSSPLAVVTVSGEHPNGRPEIVATRQTGTGLEPAVRPGVLRVKATRGEVLSLVVLYLHVNHEMTVLYSHVLVSVCSVALLFVVSCTESKSYK